MRILVTRPLEDGVGIAARLAEKGHQALLAPILVPHFQPGPAPELDGVQAILATSANGVRALARRTARRDVAVFAVGPQTAREARQQGFSDVRSADGDAQALADAAGRWAIPGGGPLLHVAGAEAPGGLAQALAARGFTVERAVLYRVDAAERLPDAVRRALQEGTVDAALFFSPRSARVFRELAAGLELASLTAFCISAATAAALEDAFTDRRIAARPNQDALLALIE